MVGMGQQAAGGIDGGGLLLICAPGPSFVGRTRRAFSRVLFSGVSCHGSFSEDLW